MDKQTQKYLLNIVKKNYDDIAVEFDITRQKKPWSELYNLAADIRDGDSVLDVGCGNGRLLETIVEKDINYLGVDNSPNLVGIAKAKYSILNTKYKFQTGDILELGKIPQLNFNWLFSIAVLHHLPGKKLRLQALKQLKNKVADDGRIIITAWNLWTQPKFRKLIAKYFFLKLLKRNKMDFGDIIFEWRRPDGQGISERYYHAFTSLELRRLIKKSGLQIERFYKDKNNYYIVLKKVNI